MRYPQSLFPIGSMLCIVASIAYDYVRVHRTIMYRVRVMGAREP